MRIFLDDLRDPKKEEFDYVVRSYEEFKDRLEVVVYSGWVEYISFDHDLGEEKSGYDCCKLLIDYDVMYNMLSDNFTFNVHSANPVGKQNIESLMNNWLKFKKQFKGE